MMSEELKKLNKKIKGCSKCELSKTRKNAVPGEGPKDADILLVGEAPGRQEDKVGKPFVGKAGDILTDLLDEANLDRDEVFIGNVLKCRPPQNRDPTQEEIEKCSPYLKEQIDIIQPHIIIALGRFASRLLSKNPVKMSASHGCIYPYNFTNHKIKLFLSYHPASTLYGTKKERLLKDFENLKVILEE